MARSNIIARFTRSAAIIATVVAVTQLYFTGTASAQTVWSGLTFNYTHADGLDPADPTSQDRLTNDVWITRGQFGGGLLNAASECDVTFGCTYTHNSSPQ